MNERPTPETDGEIKKLQNAGMDQAGKWIQTNFARKLERERDEARKALADWENAAAHVEADHPDEKHCGCVPVLRKLLADSKKERDEWAAMCGRYKQERDEAREENKWLVYLLEHIRESLDIRHGKHRGLFAFSYLREEASRKWKEEKK